MSTNDQPDELGGTHVSGTGWMYEGPNNEINKEEYLLGKQIGRNFDREGTAGQINAVEYDVAPPSIFASRATHQVDLQRKLMEDPLVAIKKREVEDRKKLMDNPLKMRALQEHFDAMNKKAKKSKKSKKVKKEKKSKSKKHKRGRSESDDEPRRKKQKKRSRSRSNSERRRRKRRNSEGSDSDSEDDDEDLDAKLLAKLQAMERGGVDKKGKVVSDDDSDEYESDSEAEERKRKALLDAGVDPNAVEAPLFQPGKQQPANPNAPEKGKGDWDCLKCGNWNFVRRTECFKCNTKKGEAKAPPKPAMFVPIPIAPIKKDQPTPVIKKRTMQLKQNLNGDEEKKDENGDSPPSGKTGGAPSRPGDWKCQMNGCGYSNFASRSSCNKCDAAKGETGEKAPVRAPYKRREGRATTPNGTLLGSPSPPPRRGRGNSGSPQRRRRSPSRERRRSRSRDRRRERSRSRSPVKSRYRGRRSPSTPPRFRRRSPDTRRKQESPEYKRKDDKPSAAPTSKQMSDAEKQAKLAEMMANADWRDEQRTSRVKKQRAEQAKEDEEAKREHDPQFLNRELKRAQENLTMEGRIGAKKHTIQRGVGDMDKNFARR